MHLYIMHCTKKPNYVFPEMKLRGLVPNSYTHVSVSDLYIPRIGVPSVFGCSKIGRPILGIYKLSQVQDCGNYKTEQYISVLEITRPRNLISRNT
jgi:hypothetical protein